jgi:hypothetical protein
MARRHLKFASGFAALASGLLLSFLCATPVRAQTWEYSPYNIRLWVAVEPTPHLAGLAERLGDEVARGARLASGMAWRVFPATAPEALHVELLTQPAGVSAAQIVAVAADAFRLDPAQFARHYVAASGDGEQLPVDKIVMIVVRDSGDAYDVEVRELDVATRQWGDLILATTRQIEATPGVALSLVVRAIRPLAKIERMDGRTAIARLRAGGLVVSPDSPASIEAGRIMTPVIRRNGRNGEPQPAGGIYAPPWSYVAIESRADTAIVGTVQSGFGSVIPAKGGPRTERLLLGLQPRYDHTRLELRARVAATPGKGPPPVGRPLSGYEVFAKNLGEEKTELVGLTDWDGGINLTVDGQHPLRLFYIKNGGQLLARLPLVVGQQTTITANVLDDDPRLAAEAYIKSLQSRVTDLVARREILAVRIRAKLKKGDFVAARKLVEEYRTLPTSAQLTRELENNQRRMSNATGVNGKRIEKLFGDAHKLLQGFLDPATVDKLAAEVSEAERKGPPPAVPSTIPATPAT